MDVAFGRPDRLARFPCRGSRHRRVRVRAGTIGFRKPGGRRHRDRAECVDGHAADPANRHPRSLRLCPASDRRPLYRDSSPTRIPPRTTQWADAQPWRPGHARPGARGLRDRAGGDRCPRRPREQAGRTHRWQHRRDGKGDPPAPYSGSLVRGLGDHRADHVTRRHRRHHYVVVVDCRWPSDRYGYSRGRRPGQEYDLGRWLRTRAVLDIGGGSA